MSRPVYAAVRRPGLHPERWAKRSAEGIPIPRRCPHCGSRKTAVGTYKDGSKVVDCQGCYTVIAEARPL